MYEVARYIDTNQPFTIGDEERCAGLYVLGKPRSGKSTLLISLALSDMEKGHVVIFIDPHTDAINELLARIPPQRLNDVILLDPTNKTHSFGLDLLRCPDRSDPLELDATCGRIVDIFAKVWGDPQSGHLGVWLDKILRNSVYLLLENPGYMLADIPLLLREDTRFRNYLLENVKVKRDVKDFWYDEFDRLSKHDKTDQVGPALARLNTLRVSHIIRHIVAQATPKVDFHKIINGGERQKIVLLRLPVHLDHNVKTLIGTMIVSQVLTAVFQRDEVPEKDRRYLGLFCDEFQNFATPDFAKLFTQTGKYKVKPVVAHQERLGQFKPGDPNRGATAAAPNKVLFSLSVHDADELAPEFADPPPTEARRERQLVISQEPVPELLRGHINPEIRAFVNGYLRIMHERREYLKEDLEVGRMIGQDMRDEAALYQIYGRMESAQDRAFIHYSRVQEMLKEAEASLLSARGQTAKALYLFERGRGLRLAIQDINRLLTQVMEG
jgi:hypothetical protein